MCKIKGCQTLPTYNFEGSKAIFCVQHKKDGMLNVVNKRCQKDGCKISATYNFEGSKALFCFEHKEDGMFNVASKKCKKEGCKTSARYNFEGNKPLFCFEHKEAEMVDVASKRCQKEGCKTSPTYNFEGKKRAFCAEHKEAEMVDVKSKRCKTFMCSTQVSNNKYAGYCLRCYIYTFPDKPVSRNYKTKEASVVDFVKNTFLDYSWINDKRVSGGCSLRRPDLYVDLGHQIIIVEIDENQHELYDCFCENRRTMELSQDFGHRPIIFIRFNPDKYNTIDNQQITSCWGTNRNGICVVTKKKQAEWSERLECLKSSIDYWLKNNTEKTVEVVELFFG